MEKETEQVSQQQALEEMQADCNYIHINCNDAFDNGEIKDTGSELYLAAKEDGGLLLTVFLNDTTGKAYNMWNYGFSLDKGGVEVLKTFLNKLP
jgi:hypothetical protein